MENPPSSDNKGGGEDPHHSTSGVDSHGVQRIVNPEPDHGVVEDHVDEGRKYPHQEGCPGCSLVTESTGGDHSTENSIDGGEETPFLPGREPEAEESEEAAAGAADHCVDDGPLHHIPVFVAGDLGVGGSVKREEAKHEDKSPEGGQRDRVAWNVSAGPVSIKSSNPRSKE